MKEPKHLKSNIEEIKSLENEFISKYPIIETVKEWNEHEPEWTEAASLMLHSLHEREMARSESVIRKAHYLLTASFVALGVIGWIIATYLRDVQSLSSLAQDIQYLAFIICLSSTLLSAVFLVISIWWSLMILRPVVYSDISIENTLKLKNSDTCEQDRRNEFRQFCVNRMYLDWECIYVRERINAKLMRIYSKNWVSLLIGLICAVVSWFSGLFTRW